MAPSVQTFLNSFSNTLEPPVRQHLKNVYACMAMCTMAAAIGASIHLFTNFLQGGFLPAIVGMALYYLIVTTPDDSGKHLKSRMILLLCSSVLNGVALGPLLEHVILVDPSIIVTALVGTAVVFVSFSICSMLSKRGQWLYLGSVLVSITSCCLLMAVANLFFGSNMLFQLQIHLGLLSMCGFILYDTQVIIEKRRRGSKDFVSHAMELFVDFLAVFRRLLIILTQKVMRERSSSRRRREETEVER